MAKITRKTQKIFGSSAGGTGITEYGSPAGGAPLYSTDPDNIQTAAWDTGWSAAALSGTEIPTFQDFNGIHFVSTRQIGYLLQEGISEFDTGTEYHQNGIVKKTGSYELYGSNINTNTGNALPSQVDDSNWKYLGDLSDLATPTSVFSEEYESAEQTITAAGSLTLAHGLTAVPKSVEGFLICKVANGGFSIGDVVPAESIGNNNGASARGVTITIDSTNINIRYGATSDTFALVNKTTGASFSFTNASWKLLIRAYV